MRRCPLSALVLATVAAACGDEDRPSAVQLSAAGTCPSGYVAFHGYPFDAEGRCDRQGIGTPLFCVRQDTTMNLTISCLRDERSGQAYWIGGMGPTPRGWTACELPDAGPCGR